MGYLPYILFLHICGMNNQESVLHGWCGGKKSFNIRADRNDEINAAPKIVAIKDIVPLSTAEIGKMNMKSAGILGRPITLKIDSTVSKGMNHPTPEMNTRLPSI